jgi:hypothetical protein
MRVFARLVLLLAVLTIALPAAAQTAQTITTKVLTNVDRTRGTITSITHRVPVDTFQVRVRLDIPDTLDYEDTRQQIKVTLYDMTETGEWHIGPSGLWTGGPATSKDGTVINPMPFIQTEVINGPTDYRGKDIRVEIEVFRPIKLGVSVITIPPAVQ